MTRFQEFWRRYRRRPSAVAGLVLLGAIAALAVFGPMFMTGDPWDTVGSSFVWPGQDAATPLGTDVLGRDILHGIMSGARVSLTIGLAAAATALTTGILIGAFAGYFRGWVEDVLMRVTDIFQTIPNFLLAFALVALFGASLVNIVLAIGLVTWPPIARLVPGRVPVAAGT